VATGFGVSGLWLYDQYTRQTYDQWQTDISRSSISLGELVPVAERDVLHPIDHPRWEPAALVTWLSERSPVVVVKLTERVRAYPLVVLLHHGVVNDQIGEWAIAVTYCPLCNSPLVYNRRVNGQVLRFGTTGMLRNGGLVLWDDRTHSWWQQLTGTALVGAFTGVALQVIPSHLVGFEQFRRRFPEGWVLVGDETLPPMSYGRNPYIGYDTSAQPLLYSHLSDQRLPATERVLAGVIHGQPVAYPFSVLARRRVINDVVANWPVVAIWHSGTLSALDRGKIDESQDVGSAALFSALVEGRVLTFQQRGGLIVDDQTGSVWNLFGEAVDGALAGTILQQYPAQPVFWFGWAANYPNTDVYREFWPSFSPGTANS